MKIHPAELANSGRNGSASAVHRIGLPRGVAPLRVAHRIQAAAAAATVPSPIISRNIQYVRGMIGV